MISELQTTSGHEWSHATLNAPRSLSALTREMIDTLDAALANWQSRSGIADVILDAAGDRAFCAGGDPTALHSAIRAAPPGTVPAQARAFFEREDRLDWRIHTAAPSRCCSAAVASSWTVASGPWGLHIASPRRRPE